MKLNKDLGLKDSDYFDGAIAAPISSDRIHYPSFHVVGTDELGVPDSGTMTIKYKLVSETSSTWDGKKKYECTVEVHEIVSADGSDNVKPPSKTDTSAGDALDKLAEARSKEKQEADEDY